MAVHVISQNDTGRQHIHIFLPAAAADPHFIHYFVRFDCGQSFVGHDNRETGPPLESVFELQSQFRPFPLAVIHIQRQSQDDHPDIVFLDQFLDPLQGPAHLGRTLTDMIIARAREAGYREMLLDTLPFLQSAQRIYRAAGFREIEKYNDSPMDDATYMKLEL